MVYFVFLYRYFLYTLDALWLLWNSFWAFQSFACAKSFIYFAVCRIGECELVCRRMLSYPYLALVDIEMVYSCFPLYWSFRPNNVKWINTAMVCRLCIRTLMNFQSFVEIYCFQNVENGLISMRSPSYGNVVWWLLRHVSFYFMHSRQSVSLWRRFVALFRFVFDIYEDLWAYTRQSGVLSRLRFHS